MRATKIVITFSYDVRSQNPAVMSTGEAEETQSTIGDGSGGPGAPTPLSVLEVWMSNVRAVKFNVDRIIRVSPVCRLEISSSSSMEDSILLSLWHTRRSIQEMMYHGLTLILRRPRRVLEQIKGISEQKATKILAEGPLHLPLLHLSPH